MSLICLSDITGEVFLSGLIITSTFCSRKRCTRYDDVMAFDCLTLTPFCLEKTSARKMAFKVLAVFQVTFGSNQVESARITITHVCFITSTL